MVYTSAITVNDLSDASVQAAPAIYQERIANEFDVRVTVIGSRVFAARILAQRRDGEVDWRALDASRLRYEHYVLPDDIERRFIALVQAFSLSFAALDFIVTPDGEHVFLEINPSGQWGWLESATGHPITDAIVDRLIADNEPSLRDLAVAAQSGHVESGWCIRGLFRRHRRDGEWAAVGGR